MSEEDRKIQKHLVDEMMKVSKTNPDVIFYMETLMKKYEELEQKVEQLEKENKELKQPQVFIDCEDTEERYGRDLYEDYLKGKIEQLENIRKEAIDLLIYVSYNIRGLEDKWLVHLIDEKLNILNKGSDKE